MVFYFTGTGNSLYVAKEICRNMEGNIQGEDSIQGDSSIRGGEEAFAANLVSIPQVMGSGQAVSSGQPLEFSGDSIGIVAPVYGHEVPPMVKDFMKQARFNTDYFYMILTYGNRHGGASELAWQLCRECNIDVKYINILLMADNWLPSFDMNEQKKMDKKVDEHLAGIINDLKDRKEMISPVTDKDRAAHQEFLGRMKAMPEDAWQHLLKISDACIGCGICEKVCPSASIRVVDGKAVHFPGHCQTCLACAHACPQMAIGLTVPEKNPNARYRNEHISLQEIIKANQQTKA